MTCVACGTPAPYRGVGPRPRYCSTACRTRAKRAQQRAYNHRPEIRERRIASAMAWTKAHPETRQHGAARRRASRAGAAGSHTLAEWREKCALLGNVCFYCGEAKPLRRDHKIPLARGGTHDITNIVPACGSCNSRKHDRTAQEYFALRAVA